LSILEDFATRTPGGSSAIQSLDEAAAISKLIIQSIPFAEFYELDQSVNSIVVEMLKPVLCFFCDGVHFNHLGNTVQLTIRIILAQPLLHKSRWIIPLYM
jgi:hypothetical protein